VSGRPATFPGGRALLSYRPADPPAKALLVLLTELYGDTPDEFRRFVATSFAKEEAQQVLTRMASRHADPASQYESALAVLEHLGLLDDAFLAALTRDRPGMRRRVEALAALWHSKSHLP
jgi:hypothetical protein